MSKQLGTEIFYSNLQTGMSIKTILITLVKNWYIVLSHLNLICWKKKKKKKKPTWKIGRVHLGYGLPCHEPNLNSRFATMTNILVPSVSLILRRTKPNL